jgi:hypothetical protein
MRTIDELLQRLQKEEAARQEDLRTGRTQVQRPGQERSSVSKEKQKASA